MKWQTCYVHNKVHIYMNSRALKPQTLCTEVPTNNETLKTNFNYIFFEKPELEVRRKTSSEVLFFVESPVCSL